MSRQVDVVREKQDLPLGLPSVAGRLAEEGRANLTLLGDSTSNIVVTRIPHKRGGIPAAFVLLSIYPGL